MFIMNDYVFLSPMYVKISLLLFVLFSCASSPGEPASEPTRSVKTFAIKGISVVAPVRQITGESLQPVVATGANSISVIPYAFCNIVDPKVKFNTNGQWWGESYSGVLETIRLAHESNLSVMLKPQLWLSRGAYTGALSFPDSSKWQIFEQTYTEYIIGFAEIADSMHIESFCIGTELGSLVADRKMFFPGLIRKVREVYKGKITYAANWDDFEQVDFWPLLDYIGVDAYFPLSDEKTPSVENIKAGWVKYGNQLELLSKKNNKQVVFTEYGYRNVDFAARQPWAEENEPVNDVAQLNALEGFYQFFEGKKWFAGGYLWKWYVDESNHHRREIDFTPQEKKGLKSVQKWYGGGSN